MNEPIIERHVVVQDAWGGSYMAARVTVERDDGAIVTKSIDEALIRFKGEQVIDEAIQGLLR